MCSLSDIEISKNKRKTMEAIAWYGLFAVVIGGGAGLWLPILIPGKNFTADGFATYVFAILAPLLADAFLHEPYWNKLSKNSRLRLVCFCGFAGMFAIIALVRDGKTGDWVSGLLGVAFALVVWFLISLHSGRFEPDETTSNTGSLGSSKVTSASLSGGGLQ